jgi:hypothetical protein
MVLKKVMPDIKDKSLSEILFIPDEEFYSEVLAVQKRVIEEKQKAVPSPKQLYNGLDLLDRFLVFYSWLLEIPGMLSTSHAVNKDDLRPVQGDLITYLRSPDDGRLGIFERHDGRTATSIILNDPWGGIVNHDISDVVKVSAVSSPGPEFKPGDRAKVKYHYTFAYPGEFEDFSNYVGTHVYFINMVEQAAGFERALVFIPTSYVGNGINQIPMDALEKDNPEYPKIQKHFHYGSEGIPYAFSKNLLRASGLRDHYFNLMELVQITGTLSLKPSAYSLLKKIIKLGKATA